MYKRNCTLTQSSVQSLSRVRLLRPNGLHLARLSYPSPTPGAYSNSCPSRQWCHPMLSSSVNSFSSWLQSFPTSGSLFQRVSSSHRVAKVLEFQLQHYSSNEYSGLIFFRIEWFDLFAVQGTLESSPAPQFKSINSLCSAFFMVQLSQSKNAKLPRCVRLCATP